MTPEQLINGLRDILTETDSGRTITILFNGDESCYIGEVQGKRVTCTCDFEKALEDIINSQKEMEDAG